MIVPIGARIIYVVSEDELLHKHGGALDLRGYDGFNCWEGWYPVINWMLTTVNRYNNTHDKDVRVVQIKEKFGLLRVYHDPYDPYIQGVIDMAEMISSDVCEQCGESGEMRDDLRWRKTLCLNHYSCRMLQLAVKDKEDK